MCEEDLLDMFSFSAQEGFATLKSQQKQDCAEESIEELNSYLY